MNGLTKHLVEGVLNEISLAPRIIFIYSGRFQPPHLGNKWVWNWLSKAKGVDNCFIATPNDNDPLTFAEKKSVFAAMGMDASKVNQSLSLYRAPSVMQKFDANKTSFVYVINEKDAETLPPRFKPYQEKMTLNAHISGESYYLVIPNEVFTVSGVTVDDDKAIKFLGSPNMDYKTSLEAFHKFFGFFDEHMYNVLVKKFEKVVEENISPIVQTTEQSSSMSPQCLRKDVNLDFNERMALAERMGVEVGWIDYILKESPDFVSLDDGDRELSWEENQAHPFFLFDEFLLLGRNRASHAVTITGFNEEKYQMFFRPKSWDQAYFQDQVRKMIAYYDNYIGTEDFHRARVAHKFPLGRVWVKDQVISFWSPKKLVIEKWDDLKRAWSAYPILGHLDDYDVEWIESPARLIPASVVSSGGTTSKVKDRELSPEEYKELLSKQHLDPNAKKELAKIAQHPNKAAEIASKLGMSVAELNHLVGVVAENAVKEIIKEDPDTVKDSDGKEIAYVYENDARAFYFFGDVPIFSVPGGKHSEVFSVIQNIVKNGTVSKEDIARIKISDGEPTKEDLVRVIEALAKHKPAILAGSDRNIRGVVVGRVWTDKKIIAFWTLRKVVTKQWSDVEKIFQTFPNLLGDQSEYQIDWLERDFTKPTPDMSSFDEVGGAPAKEKGMGISPEAYKELLSKQHTDPNVKAILKKIAGLPYNKAGALAQKMGFSSTIEMKRSLGLLEGVITEDPDTVYDKNKKFAEMVENEAIVFIGLEEGTLFGAVDTIHQDLEDALMSYIYHREWTEKVYDFGYFSNQKRTERYLIIKGKYLAEPGRIEDEGRSVYKGLSGRIWPNKKVISFWQLPEEVRQRWKIVEEAFAKNPDPTKKKDGTPSHAGTINLGRLEEYSLDFINSAGNSKGLVTVPDFLSKDDVSQDGIDVSPEEYKELLKKQHIDPAAKKKLAQIGQGPYNKANELAKKMGYSSVAQMNADIHKGLDERLVKEDPDIVKSDDGSNENLVSFSEDQARAFTAFEEFSVVTSMYHYHIHKAFQEFDQTDSWEYADKYFMDFDRKKAEDYLHRNFSNGYDGEEVQEGREFPKALSGRIWPNSKVISFWDKAYTIKKHWKNVELLFDENPDFGNIEDYKFDTLDRQYEGSKPLMSASDFSKSQSASKSLDVSKLKGAAHVMDPSLKGQLMKMAMGATPGKKQEIADKLGITVAQLNQMNTIDETSQETKDKLADLNRKVDRGALYISRAVDIWNAVVDILKTFGNLESDEQENMAWDEIKKKTGLDKVVQILDLKKQIDRYNSGGKFEWPKSIDPKRIMSEASNAVERPVIALYSGRFQPFHVNHYKAYEEMVRQFGQDKVFIVTSDKTEPGKSPFNFNQKVQIMTSVFGIPRKQIVEALHVSGDKTNRGPYYTIDKTAGQPSSWMKEIIRRAGVDQNNFGLVIGFGGKDEDRSRIAKSEYKSGQPVPNFLPDGNVQSFTIPMQDVEYKGQIINGTMIRTIITNHPEKIDLLFKILYPKGVDPKTKAMIVQTIQSSIAPVKKQKLTEGVQFGFIKHLEDMTPNELFDFFKLWNADATKFETFEKIDGNFYRFGLADGKFYVKDSKRSYADSAEYPDLYFYDDFRKFHQALQKIDWKKVLLDIGAEDTENFEADSEAVPHAHHNQVEYDGKIIGEGIVVVFGLTFDGEKKKHVNVMEFCESANRDASPIKFHAIPKVDLSKVKFEDKTVETLETLITKHGNFLKKPARKPEEKELKQKVLGIVKAIALKAKNKVLSADIKSAFGHDYEGMVVHLPGGGMVKLVDKDKFTKSKDENWKVISDMEAVIKPIRDAMKKGETEGIADKLREAKKKIDTIYAEFKKHPESVKSEKKRADTHKHYQLVQSQIDKALGELSKGSITEGGNAVAANTAIPRNYLETTIEYGLKLWDMAGVKYEPLGNINKAMLGDIDVGIDYKDMEKVLGVPFENQEEFWKAAQTKFSHQATKVPGDEPKYKIMKGLDIISVLTPVVSDEKKILPDQFCQIDLAIGDLQFMKAGRSGAPKDSKYKAMFRNILIADILSTIWREQIDPNTYRRYQINFSKGVQTADITKGPKGGEKKINVKTLINDPDKLAEFLFKGNTKWEDINGFEKLYKKLIGPDFKYPEKVQEIVNKFKVSIKNNKMDVPSEV